MRFIKERFKVEYVHPISGEFIDILGVDSEGSGTRLTPEEAMDLRNQLSVEINKVGQLSTTCDSLSEPTPKDVKKWSWDMEYRTK
jgi:hypothetical protein